MHIFREIPFFRPQKHTHLNNSEMVKKQWKIIWEMK